MSQESQGTDAAAMENAPVKRKRGRPWKDENLAHRELASASQPVIEMVRRNQRLRIDQTTDAMVGHVVSGVLEGSFDAGYLLAVKVGNTNTVLKGVVFEPGLSVLISVANDVAPHVKMFKRNEISLPVVDLPTQVPGSNLQSKQNNERVVKVSRNEGALPSKVSPPVKQVPRASPLSPSQVQINTMASSKGEIHDVNRVPKTATHALQPEDCKAKSSPNLPAKGLAGEASGDASHVVVSLQPTATQMKSRMPTDVMQKDKPDLPVDASQVIQVYIQTAAPQIGKRKSIDLLSNAKSEPPASEPEGVSGDINRVIHVPLQAAESPAEADKSEPPASDPEGVPSDINRVIHVPLQATASQIEAAKSEPPASELEGVPSDINRVIHVPLQAAASQTQARKSTTNKFDLPQREPEGPSGDAIQVVEDSLQGASSQIEYRESTNVLPDDKVDRLTPELHGSNHP